MGGLILEGEELSPQLSCESLQNNLNIVWTVIAGILVFFMQAGFAMVEAGFTRAKNSANIMMKNMMDFATGSLTFFLIGSALMFGTTAYGVIGTDGFFMEVFEGAADWNWSGREDSNFRLLAPEASALTRLSHAPTLNIGLLSEDNLEMRYKNKKLFTIS